MRRRRNRNRKRIDISPRYFLLGLTGLCIVLMLASLFAGGIFAPVKEFTNTFVQPMQKGVNTIGRWVQSKTEAFQNYDTLLKENEDLKNQLETCQKQISSYQQDSYELERLQALYDLDTIYSDYKKTAARVISKDTGGWFDVFYVDKGTDAGIKEGCNVLYGNGLCGIVTEVGTDYAKIRSIIDDTSNVNGMVLPSESICNIEGSVNNYNNGYLVAENIDKDADINIGDQVVTSYVSSKYLSGLNIGYITKIEEDSNNLTKTAYITPACDFSKIQEVLVILETKKTVSE
ncbi:MAG: rod shape-determining protein MreC [Clostridiales bacterium]|nr:rod shape-determining protein MreC [Clostridiales bacterium]